MRSSVLLLSLVLPACSDYAVSKASPATIPTLEDDGDTPVTDTSDVPSPNYTRGEFVGPCEGAECDDTCEVATEPGAEGEGTCGEATTVVDPFSTEILWRYETDGMKSMGTVSPPLVARITDDDGDGDVDDRDPLDVAILSPIGLFYEIIVLDAATGAINWHSGGNWHYGAYLQVADVTGDGQAEVLAYSQQDEIVAFDREGNELWRSDCVTDAYNGGGSPGLTVADLDGDGDIEVVAETRILDGATGATVGQLDHLGVLFTGPLTTADLDEDGQSEILYAGSAYEADGTQRWASRFANGEGVQTAVVDVDGDGLAEVVTAGANHLYIRDGGTGDDLVSASLPNSHIGPLCTGDLDGDGRVEIVIPASGTIGAYDLDGVELWSMPVDTRGYASCSTFDMDGDGAAEVLFSDEQGLWVFDGCTGDVEMTEADMGSWYSGTYPVVADVDEDGHPEILVSGTNAALPTGVTVYRNTGSGWPAAPEAWPQYDAGMGKVDAYGVPLDDATWWVDDATLRGVTPEVPASTDLALLPGDQCSGGCEARATRAVAVQVQNRGRANVRGADVVLTATDGRVLATESVPLLGPGEISESIVLTTTRAYGAGDLTVSLVVEDDDPTNDTITVSDEACP